MTSAFWKALLLPQRQPMLALAGAGIGLFGDVVDFFTSFFPRGAMFALFVLFAAGTLYLCWKVATRAVAAEAVGGVLVDCPECNATRFGIFATIAFGVLSIIGQGESATEKLGTQLGLIQRDVSAIRETLEPQSIIARPKSAADHFNNAFVYRNFRRDTASTAREMRALYALEAPRKMDAAQLYFDALTATEARTSVIAEMTALAERSGDATLLIVAARGADDPAASARLVERARAMDPELPYSWWDPMIPAGMPGNAFTRPGEEAARLRKEINRIEKFRSLSAASPLARWHYMPQMAGDPGSSTTMLLESYRKSAAMYEDMESGKFQRELREKMAREQAQQRR